MKNVEAYIKDILKERKVHFTLIDPDEQTPEEALDIATEAIEGGTDGIMIGGSTVDNVGVNETCKILSDNIAVPIIIFPGNTSSVSKYADAIFFMSYLNSNNPYWIIGATVVGNPAATVITSSPRFTLRSPSSGEVNAINARRFAEEPELTSEQ